ncbi:MAG: hypothetical protein U0836_26155 [Pirellulales bacterium]
MIGAFELRRLPCLAWLALVLAGVAQAAAEPPSLPAAEGCGCGRTADQVWLLSTRRLGCGAEETLPQGLGVFRYEDCRWRVATFEEFLGSGAAPMATHVWVHGNQISAEDACKGGLQVYRALAACAPEETPLRFVIWSWPSQKQHGPLRDVKAKADRSDLDALFFGWFLGQLEPDGPVTLAGYSFGARIITGGLHLAGGGELAGRVLEPPPDARAAFRVALLAAAVDNDWLLPGRRHGQALSQIEQILLLNNSCDRVLKRYHWLEHDGDRALGYTGLAGAGLLGDERWKVRQMNVCSIVGKQHDWTNYFDAPSVAARIRVLTFAQE